MFKYSLLIFLFIFVIYEITIRAFPPKLVTPQSSRQNNIIKAQTFIYDNNHKSLIIAGSSLSGTLSFNTLGSNFVDLSFSGMGSLEGLYILTKTGYIPKVLFIEINYIDRINDDAFNKYLFNPLFIHVLKYCYSFREKYKFLNYITSFQYYYSIRDTINQFVNNIYMHKSKTKSGGVSAKPSYDDALNKVVDIAIKNSQNAPDQKYLKNLLTIIKVELDRLASSGTKIVFFEMPMHPKVSDSPRANLIRNCVYDIFPSDTYSYIYLPNPINYHTLDGYHLDHKSAIKYTAFFYSSFNDLNFY